MVVKYIGRVSNWKGKTLFEIAKRLKDRGKGRVVYRSSVSDKYPEKCYFTLTEVVPNMADENHRSGSAWGQKVFRGRKFNSEFEIDAADKSDWILVARRDEENFCKIGDVFQSERVTPQTVTLPPLLGELYSQYQMSEGEAVGDNTIPCLTVDYTHERFKWK